VWDSGIGKSIAGRMLESTLPLLRLSAIAKRQIRLKPKLGAAF